MRLRRVSFGSLQTRLWLTLSFVAIVPLAIVGGGGALYARNVIAEESTRELTGLARGLAEELDLYISGLLLNAQAIAGLPPLSTMDPAQQEPLLRDLFHLYPQFSRLSIYGLSGDRLATSRPAGPAFMGERASYRSAIERGTQVWEVFQLPSSGRLTFVSLTPIRDENRRVVGVLTASVDLESLSSLVNRVRVGGGGEAIVLDASGSVLLHPRQTAIRERWDYSWTGVTSQGRPAGVGTARFSDQNEYWVAGYAPLPSVAWVVLVTRPVASIHAPADELWRLAMFGLGLTAILAAIAAAVIARTLSRPVNQLATAARALGAGESAAPLPRVVGDSTEIGRLVQAFHAMRDTVLDREKQLREEARTIETLHRVGNVLAAELDLERLLQAITDGGTELSGAKFGAFFHNVKDDHGESYTLYTLSGASRESFARFPMPRNTAIFAPTFHGEPGAVRIDDVTVDSRYGKNPPYHGLPEGHLPVRSYLAVPVVSRSGEVVGGLFFGHPEPGVFSTREERLILGLAAQAAIAIDNAQLYRQAQRAIQTREVFISVAAHELKTPVTSLKLTAQFLLRILSQDKAIDSALLTRMVSIVDQQSDKLTGLINQLLDISRLRAGKLMLDPVQVDLVNLVAGVVEQAQSETGTHRLVLRGDRSAVLKVDPLRIEQVLVNLFGNAIKFGPPDSEIHVTVVRTDHHTVVVSVRDFGDGVPAEYREQIFDRFYQMNGNERSTGLGLGLYVSRQIVELHGGHLWVQDPDSGVGAEFILELPVNEEIGGQETVAI
jgi:signal transduction histidine kinase